MFPRPYFHRILGNLLVNVYSQNRPAPSWTGQGCSEASLVVTGMSESEVELIRRAIDLLVRVLPDGAQRPQRPASRPCPVLDFAKRYLMRDPASDVTTRELWVFFSEVVAAGELEPLGQRTFQRALPSIIEGLFGARKSHCIQRGDQALRGFKGVGIREAACPATPDAGPQ